MRKLIIFLMLTAGVAFAQVPVPTSGNVFFGYSYYNTPLGVDRQSLNGWQGSIEGKVLPFIGIVGDLSANYGDLKFPNPAGTCAIGVPCPPVSVNSHIDNLLFGPRVSVPVGPVRPFAEALFGGAHVSTHGFGNDTSFATAIGGGIDFRMLRILAWRFQGDYIHTHLFNAPQNNLRLSTGIVLRF